MQTLNTRRHLPYWERCGTHRIQLAEPIFTVQTRTVPYVVYVIEYEGQRSRILRKQGSDNEQLLSRQFADGCTDYTISGEYVKRRYVFTVSGTQDAGADA